MFAHMALHEKRSKLCFYRLLGDRNKKNDWWIDIIKLGINHQESWPKWPSILQKCIVTSPKILTQIAFYTTEMYSNLPQDIDPNGLPYSKIA
jgi:hypothetical protein